MDPLIIEAAINGGTPKSRNPNAPRTPAEVAADTLACMEAGAAVIHAHNEDYLMSGQAAADNYLEGWRPVFAARPDAVISSTVLGRGGVANRYGHFRALAEGGMRMGVLDPGSVNLADHGADGLPGGRSFVYANSYQDIAEIIALLAELRLGPSMAIYEPGFLRTALFYERAGKMPAGAMVKLYFNGDYNFLDGQPSHVAFGLPPTAKALAAYLEMLEGSSMPWAAAVLGGCVAKTGMARLAIAQGGHVRLGLEDYAGPDAPKNVELIREVVEIARACGRRIATPGEAAEILRLPR
jgi:uncharacterized protein (DUF849 family)